MLFLLTEKFEDVIWAHFHHWEFLIDTLVFSFSLNISTCLILLNLAITTLWHLGSKHYHELWLLHVWLPWSSLLSTPSSVFTVRTPIVVSLIVLMILVESIIQVTIKPWELWNSTQEEWHLSVLIGLVVVSGSDWVKHFVCIRVHHLVTPVIMWLLVVVLRHVRSVKISSKHIYYNLSIN